MGFVVVGLLFWFLVLAFVCVAFCFFVCFFFCNTGGGRHGTARPAQFPGIVFQTAIFFQAGQQPVFPHRKNPGPGGNPWGRVPPEISGRFWRCSARGGARGGHDWDPRAGPADQAPPGGVTFLGSPRGGQAKWAEKGPVDITGRRGTSKWRSGRGPVIFFSLPRLPSKPARVTVVAARNTPRPALLYGRVVPTIPWGQAAAIGRGFQVPVGRPQGAEGAFTGGTPHRRFRPKQKGREEPTGFSGKTGPGE